MKLMECPETIICERCGATLPLVEENGQYKYICTEECGFFLVTTQC